uniref:restriction endonuclease subunit S n=1 Tax=Acinetobacter nosocomialis TaxID=106654 RepID=UPI001EFF1B6D|nr:restriction endonuclease subunit S [Acinetobacter nosocomialis]UKC63552.1 hypothetical protein FA267_2_00078 [Acinetobacter nosocomialis]UKC63732.1 hypothetical protein FA648_2_00123 [Acinetobacter nosocomialis]
MQFEQYPSYKNSGVEWLGDVPEHWQIVRTKDIFNHRKEEALEDDEIVTAFRDGQVTLRKNRRTDGFTNSIKEHGYQHINNGDLVIHEMDAFAGAIGVSDSSGKSTPVYTVCYAKNENINHHFYSHFFRTMAKTGFINSLAKGIRVRSTEFRWNESRNVYLAEPPKADQEKIVAFLNTETIRIDNLITKQEKLIELLEEQRKSIISHAVTKGLNPNAPMKDSGVEWLGEVPEHWEVKKIKRISPVNRGASPRPINDLKYFDDNGEYAWVRISDVTRSNGFLFETEQRLSSLGASFSVKLEPESLFLSIAATVGKPCITKIKTCIHDGFVYFPKLNKHRDLLFNIFESKLCFVGLGKLGTQLNLNSETVEDIYVAIPPESEEKAILGYIQTETTRIDNLISKQKSLIEKLKEYRASIISHAVTGKIDVREFY